MSLAAAIRGSTHRGQRILWQTRDSPPRAVDLTGATITGVIQSVRTGQKRPIEGMLLAGVLVHEMEWIYDEADVEEAGKFRVQFLAVFPDGTEERSYIESWEVLESL